MPACNRRRTVVCSLLFAWRAIDDAPVVLAANRDEAYDRAATGPRLLTADPRVLAPVDQAAGGTWIGVNEYGLVVAIANREDGPEGERSRGQLVRDLLGTDTADEARTYLASILAEQRYAGFHLVLLDANDAFYVTWDGSLDGRELATGIHLLDNDGIDESSAIPRSIRADLEPDAGETPASWLDRALVHLRDHDAGLCVHGDRYGTVSTTTISVSVDGAVSLEVGHADGPPCENDLVRTTLDSHI